MVNPVHALQRMVVGGIHPPWSTVRNLTKFFYGSPGGAGLVNHATASAGSTFTATAGFSGTHPKWASTAVFPNGNGSYADAASNANHVIGTGDFLMEWWQWTGTLTVQNNGVKVYVDTRLTTSSTSMLTLYATAADGSLKYSVDSGATNLITTAAGVINITSNQLISICRVSGTTTLYVDGVSVGSASDSTNYAQCRIRLGNTPNGAGGTTLWIGEFRFASGSGSGIYSANFTIPCGPFPIGGPP